MRRECLQHPEHAALTGPEQTHLDEILAVCGDGDNRTAYPKIIRMYPEGGIVK